MTQSSTRLLDVADLAGHLHKTRQAIYMLRHKGELPPAIVIGRVLYWRQSDIDAWIESKVEVAR